MSPGLPADPMQGGMESDEPAGTPVPARSGSFNWLEEPSSNSESFQKYVFFFKENVGYKLPHL